MDYPVNDNGEEDDIDSETELDEEEEFNMLTKRLMDLGIAKNDATIYLTLLRYGECNPSELATLSNVDRSRVYDSLKRLAKREFIDKEPISGSSKYRAVPPDKVFRILKEAYIQKIKNINYIEKRVKNLPKKQKQENITWVIKDRKEIRELIITIIEKAERLIYLILTDDIFGDMDFMEKIKNTILQKKISLKEITVKISLVISENVQIKRSQNPMKNIISALYHSGVEIYHMSMLIPPFGIALNEKIYLQTFQTQISPKPRYEFGIKIENISDTQLQGFKYLCDYIFTSLCRKVVIEKKNS